MSTLGFFVKKCLALAVLSSAPLVDKVVLAKAPGSHWHFKHDVI